VRGNVKGVPPEIIAIEWRLSRSSQMHVSEDGGAGMNATAATLKPGYGGWASRLWRRQLSGYPDTGARLVFLAITVLATVTLYYELYVGGSVSTLLLANLHMSFTFYVVILAFGNLVGAFGSLLAGLADRLGRANMVVFGLLFTGVFTAFVLPYATDKWTFGIETFVVALVEGMCLVATPALIRDFSPQVGRATAMGFWIAGPMLGSLIVAVVGSHTIPTVVADPRFWTHEYRICGITGLVVFVIALIGLRELSPQLRDQLMVTMRDRALVEARAKNIDIDASLRRPFRQLLKPDIVISAIGVSVFLLLYFTAVGFLVIYMTTVFGFSVKNANGLGNWQWGFNVVGVIVFGVISDLFRVRKPFMLIGGILAAVALALYIHEAGHHLGYYSVALMLVFISLSFALAVTPWLASFTETVEARNPALTATGLAIWGWSQRVVAFAAFLLIPVVITSVTPLVNYGTTVSAYATTYAGEISFANTHPTVVAAAATYKTQLAEAEKFGPELAVIQAHPALFDKLATYSNPATIPPALLQQGIAAAGGGAHGAQVLETIAANKPVILGLLKVAPQLQAVEPFETALTALSKVPPQVFPYLQAHGAAVTKAEAGTAGQWKDWYWICFGGIIFFLLCIPLVRGRWKPSAARHDEREHEAMVATELAALAQSRPETS
jgi:MFS family permease